MRNRQVAARRPEIRTVNWLLPEVLPPATEAPVPSLYGPC